MPNPLYKYISNIYKVIQATGLKSRLFANVPGDRVYNPRSSNTKDTKKVLAAALFNIQHYKVRIKGKVEQSREWGSALPYTSVK